MPTIAEDAGTFIKVKIDKKRKLVDTFIQEHRDMIAPFFEDPETFDKFALNLVKLELDIPSYRPRIRGKSHCRKGRQNQGSFLRFGDLHVRCQFLPLITIIAVFIPTNIQLADQTLLAARAL